MATTGTAIHALLAGLVNPSTGAAAASAKARFYQPGTLVARDVFSDDACTAAITQPYTLGSGGEAKLFMLEPVRMIVKDSADSTTLWDVVLVQRERQVYITHPSVNGGAETTLYAFLTTAGASLGADFLYKESSGATARNYSDWLGEDHVSAKDFAALGDDANDDTAEIQAAIDRVSARGGGEVVLPKGTYRISSALAIGTTSSYIGVSLRGTGEGGTIIKQTSTTANGITVNVGSATDCKLTISNLTITASTTSSGKAIEVTAGDRVRIDNVHTRLFRTGIDVSAVSGAVVKDCVIESTDDNAAAVGITLGTRSRAVDCEVISGTTNGSGIVLGADASTRGCYVSKFATGILQSGVRSHSQHANVSSATTGVSITGTGGSRITDSYVTGGTTGISLGAADSHAEGCVVASATTGVSLGAARTVCNRAVVSGATTGITVGAFADCVVTSNRSTTNTTDISVNSSSTGLVEYGNSYSVISDSATTPHSWLKDRAPVWTVYKSQSSAAGPSFTPTPQTATINIFESTYAGAPNITINATSTTGLQNGQLMLLVYSCQATSLTNSFTFNSQYANYVDGDVNTDRACSWLFMWVSSTSKWVQILQMTNSNANSDVLNATTPWF